MDQKKIGVFIALKRKEQNLTQEKLALQLGVSNKSISKWETGKCMPDLSTHKPLCQVLHISINELMAGEDIKDENIVEYADKNILDMLKLYKKLKSQKDVFIGLLLIVVGRFLPITSAEESASDSLNFISGVSYGLSIGIILIGVGWLIYGLVRMSQEI